MSLEGDFDEGEITKGSNNQPSFLHYIISIPRDLTGIYLLAISARDVYFNNISPVLENLL
tara:strand:- start:506 stop:685 length:180 start_codon:yes stop_codon:yes gene_type:complete